jgi:hypothetical protein
VLAPHPDDEVLGTGGLLQMLAREQATVRVVLLTCGENNPWPQRLLERRWLHRRAGTTGVGRAPPGRVPHGVAMPRSRSGTRAGTLGWPDGEIGDR